MARRLVMTVSGLGMMAIALAGCFGNGTTATNTGVAGQPGVGLYRTIGDQGGACTITRTTATNAKITYQNGSGGPLYIRVKADDKAVTSAHCELWQLAGLVPPIFETSTIGSYFRSGDYRVSYEIKPGTYQADGPTTAMCSYATVSDFTHENAAEVIGFIHHVAPPATGPITVTFSGAEFGFWSENCGDWHRTA